MSCGAKPRAVVLTGVVLSLAFGPQPVETPLRERVDVDYVLLDVSVVERDGSVVTDLAADELVLKVDGRRRPVDSLDLDCPQGAPPEPRAVEPGRDDGWRAPDEPRRIVLAFDYRHLERVQRAEVLERLRDGVARLAGERELVMVVALTDLLRIEQPFTAGSATTLSTLARMHDDITLWEPAFHHLHDRATFAALRRLIALLDGYPGAKQVVLFSNWPSSGLHYDPDFDELSSLAARARVAFYPVWTRGLTVSGTSRRLARLAVQSGGRFTERTNDLALGYARAQHAAACRYTIGFADPGDGEGGTRKVSVRVRRRGVRVSHPTRYALGGEAALRSRRAEAAAAEPSRFGSDAFETRVRVIGPRSRKRFDVELVVTDGAAGTGEGRELRTELTRANTLYDEHEESYVPPYAMRRQRELRAGRYRFTAVSVPPQGEHPPVADEVRFELSELGAAGWFVGEAGPVGRYPPGASVEATLRVCRFGEDPEPHAIEVRWALHAEERDSPLAADVEELVLAAGDGLRCRDLVRRPPGLRSGRFRATWTVRTGQGSAAELRESVFVLSGE